MKPRWFQKGVEMIAKIFQNQQNSWTLICTSKTLTIATYIFTTKNEAIAKAFALDYPADKIKVGA
jgi:hypothetical protein